MAKRSPMAAATAATAAVPTAAPIVHAVGGSLGSALALLLLYPLERARIEQQSQTANRPSAPLLLATALPSAKGEAEATPSPPVAFVIDQSVETGKAECQAVAVGDRDGEGRVQQTAAAAAASIPSPNNSDASSSSFEVLSHGAAAHTPAGSSDDDDEERIPSDTAELVPSSPPEDRADSVWSTLTNLHRRGELYRGVRPITTTLAVSNFVFFYALQVTKSVLASDGKRARKVGGGAAGVGVGGSRIRSLLASSLAGVINVLLTNPLWVANLRIVRGYAGGTGKDDGSEDVGGRAAEPGLLSVMRQIAREEGLGQLWTGTWASLLLVSNPAIQFFAYEQLRLDILGRRAGRNGRGGRGGSAASMPTADRAAGTLSPAEAFVVGAAAKTVATVVTYPVQLAQTLLRLQKRQAGDGERVGSPLETSRSTVDQGTLACLMRLFQEGGVKAIYAGMNAKLLQTVLTAAFTFLTYEQILAVVQRSLMALPTIT